MYKMICLINFVFGLLKTPSVGIKINSWLYFLRNVSNNRNALFHFWKWWVHGESCFQITILTAAALPPPNFVKCICYRRKSFTHISAYCTTAAGSFRHEEVRWLHRRRRFMMILSGSNSKTQFEGQLYHRLRHWLVVTHVQFTRMISW